MKKILRDNEGSISALVVISVLLYSIVLTTAYMKASGKRRIQIQSQILAKDAYEKHFNNLDEIREEIIGLPGTDETQPYYPSSEFKKVKGTNLDNGLVIEDGDGNQYVWVEVPKNTTVYPTAGLNITDFTDDEYTKIENDLHTYTGVYRSETIYADTWVDDTDNEGWFSESEYYAHKKKMLKSVYQYGGFYVGRYEAGIAPEKEQARNYDASDSSVYSTLHETTQQIITKENAYPYNWVRRTQAKKLAESVNSGDKTSSLMFGIQWDLVLAFMNRDTTKVDSNILTNDSATIGNYRDASFQLNKNGKYSVYSDWLQSTTWNLASNVSVDFVDSNGNKLIQTQDGYGVLITTGTSERNKVMNIYDIAGNVIEWTLENKSGTDTPCVGRGGDFHDKGSIYASARYGVIKTSCTSDIGFRVSIF